MNEDAFATLPEGGMVVVADGMGGYRAGEVASQLAVDVVLRHLIKHLDGNTGIERCLIEAERAVEQANLTIWRATDNAPELEGMGTTAVIGIFQPNELAYAWVGDSRLYRVRDGRLDQLTSDHTVVQELVNQGLFASVSEAVTAGVGDHVLSRALGAEKLASPDTGSVALAGGDLYLFCTDGLTHMVDDVQLLAVLADRELELDAKAKRIIQLACDAGGLDNITVILVEVAEG
jgi:protein phosphatase